MSTFSDDFERGDGGLGNNWETKQGTPTITSGRVGGAAAYITKQSGASGGGRQEVIAQVYYSANGDLVQGPLLKTDPSDWSGYLFRGTGTLAAPSWYILRIDSQFGSTTLSQIAGSGLSVGYHTLRCLYNQGVLTLWVDGYLISSVSNSTWDAKEYFGYQSVGGSSGLEAITALFGEATDALSVSPEVIGNYGGSTAELTLTGTGTAWSSTSPTFTVDHGSLSDINITSDTEATATYSPGTFLGTATITDPTTGASDTLVVTSDTEVVPPTGGDTWSPYKDLVDSTGQTNDPTYLLTDETPFIPASSFDFGSAGAWPVTDINLLTGLQEMFAAVVAQQKVIPPTADSSTEIMRWISGGVHSTYVNVDPPIQRSIAKWLETIGGVYDLSLDDLYAAISDIEAPPGLDQLSHDIGISDQDPKIWTSLLQVLLGMWGVGGADISSLGNILNYLTNTSTISLADVLTAIGDIEVPDVDLSSVLTAISNLRGGTATVTQVYNLLSDVNDDLQAIKVSLSEMRTEQNLTLADILEAIDAIDLPEGSYEGPPVWPGSANVTMGDPVALTGQVHSVGACDGVIVSVTAPPTRTGKYVIGGSTYYYSLGWIAFETDDGDLEPWQYLGFGTAVFTPRSMRRAGGFRATILAGGEATVTPWVKS